MRAIERAAKQPGSRDSRAALLRALPPSRPSFIQLTRDVRVQVETRAKTGRKIAS